ncbi:MAG: helix-turn-helix domain-containing protein [Candidatus Caldatribacteriaceae bacterium]
MYSFAVITEPPYPPSWQISPHRHAFHEIGLVKSGRCIITLDTTHHFFDSHEVFFFPSFVAHGFATDKFSGVEFVVIQFAHLEPPFVQALTNTPPIGRFKLLELEASIFLSLAYRLQRESVGNLPWNHLQCQALLEELVVLLLRSHERGSSPYLNADQQRLIEQALLIMQSKSHENLKIQKIAQELGLSPQHFRDLFRRYVGKSPKEYLTALKLQRSTCMLLHGEYTIADIALRLGFASVQQFSKAFRKKLGITPAKWRRTQRVTTQQEKRQPLFNHDPQRTYPRLT